ncbi:MAG TPA: serine hydrolase domain-containing protein, partial [Pyrinomonadaceae bacterium]|nr:serine hydrolase domain-containing protein [Pyrinomonadaceae bacterium]
MDSTERDEAKQEYVLNDLNLDLNALPNEPQIDRYLNKYLYALGAYLPHKEDRARIPGAAVMVRKGSEIVHLNCYGYANIETGEKITPNTLFDLGSLSKQFTALAVLGLVYFKEIDIQDNISKFFDGMPRYADSITVEQLIHHTSGLPDYIDLHVAARQVEEDWYDVAMATRDEWYPQMCNRQQQEITNRNVVEWIASQKLLPRKPNTEFEYSNSGYVVLAELVERVTKKRFADYVKERIFDWVGLKNTYVFDGVQAFDKDAPEIINHARCYNRVKGERFVPVGYTPLNFINGDGNVHSNILDLAQWDLNLNRLDYGALNAEQETKSIAQAFRDLLWAPAQVKSRKQVNYGAGWNLLYNKYEDDVEEIGERV